MASPADYHEHTEDFEKVEPMLSDPEQEELVTSTGEEAEEDRYAGTAENISDPFSLEAAFGGPSINPSAPEAASYEQTQPLINFGSAEAEPSAPPPTQPEKEASAPASEPYEFVPEPSKTEVPNDLSEAPPVSTETPTEGGLQSLPGAGVIGGWLKNLDPRVRDLIYWKDIRTTGVVFGGMMFLLLSLALFSLMSVLAYLSLAVLTVTFSFRVYKSVMQAVQKTNEGHPFGKYLDTPLELNEDQVQQAVDIITRHLNNTVSELRRLYLVQDYVDSLKFGLLLWVLTYIGAWFNGMTLVILVVVSIFTLPKVYDTYKVQIDSYINMARAQLNKIISQIQAKIPFPKKKAKTQ